AERGVGRDPGARSQERGPAVRATIAETRVAPIQPGTQSSLIMAHGSMTLRFYAPQGPGRQRPHEKDELYVVARPAGHVLRGPAARPCRGGRRAVRRGLGRPPLRELLGRLRDLGCLLRPVGWGSQRGDGASTP